MEKERNKASMKENNKKKKAVILLLLVLCLSAGGYFFIHSWLSNNNKLPREKDAQEGFLPGMSEEEIQKMMDEKVAEGSVQISINSELVFPTGSSKGYIRIENTRNNHYLQVVEINRKDNGELIYKSGAMEPGNYLEQARLDVDLKKGEYPVVVHFKNYDLKSEEFVGEAIAETVVRVLE